MKGKFKNIVFVIPDPESFISGGNSYNIQFLKVLRSFDPAVRNIDFATFKKLNASQKVDLYFIDTFYFKELKKYKGDLSKCFLIVHLLMSLDQAENKRASFFENEEKETLDRFGGFLSTSPFAKNYLLSLGYKNKAHLVLPPAINSQPTIISKLEEQVEDKNKFSDPLNRAWEEVIKEFVLQLSNQISGN